MAICLTGKGIDLLKCSWTLEGCEPVNMSIAGDKSVKNIPQLAEVPQSCLVVPHEMHFNMLYRLLLEHILEEPNYKCRDMNVST
ncbi:uncharacterized protein LOC144554641 isoform X2 [Carex rostrata]